ncbi:uncharacterized protein LOC126819486 [Patella vulgata]|uniref:uncharacterized protein LOC126819486 n=1 Tax=Patella vulgata TaxID=6465 RepID=UPI00217FD216|nr:uncharacterized protein LOC126819486 [Patella vulgata]
MESIKMRRSKFRKLCVIIFIVLLLVGVYYVYGMKFKTLYDKYSRLLKEQEEYDRHQSLQNLLKKHGRDQYQAQRHKVKGRHEVVNGVEFFIDEKHEDPKEPVNNAVHDDGINVDNKYKNWNPNVDDHGNKIPDDDPYAFQRHHGHEHHHPPIDPQPNHHDQGLQDPPIPHQIENLESEGENKKEREVIGGVEVVVEHNGEAASLNNPQINRQGANNVLQPEQVSLDADKRVQETIVKDVEKSAFPLDQLQPQESDALKKVHELMKKYQDKMIKTGNNNQVVGADGAAAQGGLLEAGHGVPGVGGAIGQDVPGVRGAVAQAVPDVEGAIGQAVPGVGGVVGQGDSGVNVGADQNNPQVAGNAVGAEQSKDENILKNLVLDGPLDDNKIMNLVISGKVKGKAAMELMKYYSRNKPQPPSVLPPALPPIDFLKPTRAAPVATQGVDNEAFNVYDTHQNVDLTFNCVSLKLIINSTKICVNDPLLDKPISENLARKGVWEAQNLQEFQRALEACHDCGVIDLGANLGVYSLTSAVYGRQVLAVEPLLQSIGPFHKSIQLNEFTENITLLRNAISDVRGYAEVKYPKPLGNLGSAYVVPVDYKEALQHSMDIHRQIVKTITLDDLVKILKFKKAILKVDISGSEHLMFKSSKTFLNAIDVPFIFMHWAHEESKVETLETADILLKAGYKPKITVGGTLIEIEALTRDQGLLIWAKQYPQQ